MLNGMASYHETQSLKDNSSSPTSPSKTRSQFTHIASFGFNAQILITDITFNDNSISPYLSLRCQCGEAPILTPYSQDLLEFCQDPDASNIGPDSLLLKLQRKPDLSLVFGFDTRTMGISGDDNGTDWFMIHADSSIDLTNILAMLDADPNFSIKNERIYAVRPEIKKRLSNSDADTASITWTWKWEALPNPILINGGYKNICAFVKRTDTEFHLVADFSFWINISSTRSRKASVGSVSYLPRMRSMNSLSTTVANTNRKFSIPDGSKLEELVINSPKPITGMDHNSIAEEEEGEENFYNGEDLATSYSPESMSEGTNLTNGNNPLLDINVSGKLTFAEDDGPVFRATLNQLEKKVTSFKQDIKKILKLGQEAVEARKEAYEVEQEFMDAILSMQTLAPLVNCYLYEAALLTKSADESWLFQTQSSILDPLKKVYDVDIKAAESKKKSFEQESDEYYSYLSKYLSAKKDKGKKSNFSDARYQERQKQFELARFNYYSYIYELRGGGKDQEVLSMFSSYAEKQLSSYETLSQGLSSLKPNLEELMSHVSDANKELLSQRKDRDEKRRQIIKNESELAELMFINSSTDPPISSNGDLLGLSKQTSAIKNKFLGIRDLQATNRETALAIGRKREGFLFTHSRIKTGPGKFDKNLPGQSSWHKKWCVLSGGYLHEYNNWKKQLEANFEPVPLQFATVRIGNQSARKFCFEIVTPKYRRQYQATSEDDMMAWIAVISNSIESLWNGTSSCDDLKGHMTNSNAALNGGFKGELVDENGQALIRSPLSRELFNENHIDRQFLAELLRKDESNRFCADCDSNNPEWCSINFGILLCIECSGIHRSLGTHITKVRSLTLDVVTFTSDLVTLMQRIGNGVSNSYWEAKLDEFKLYVDESSGNKWVKPTQSDERAFKLKYISAKYVDHQFLTAKVPAPSLDASVVDQFARNLMDVNSEKVRVTSSLFCSVFFDEVMPALQAIVLGADIDGLVQIKGDSPLVSLFGVDSHITPLHLSMFLLNEDDPLERAPYSMSELLIQNGANVNATSATHHSLLHFAALHNDLPAIQYLLLKGATPTLPADNFDMWPCFLASDYACQQLLLDVTYNEALKMNFDENKLAKLAPALPPRVRSDDEGDIDMFDKFSTNQISLLPPTKELRESASFHDTHLSPTGLSGIQSNESRPTEMLRSISTDSRALSQPLKRLSGGWKNQLSNFKPATHREREREGFVPGHGHSHSLTVSSSSNNLNIPNFHTKKSMFRRSGHPFMSQDLSYLASSAPNSAPIHSRPPPLTTLRSPIESSHHQRRQSNLPSFQEALGPTSSDLPNIPVTVQVGGSPVGIPVKSMPANPFVAKEDNKRNGRPNRTASIMEAFRKLSK